MPNDLWFGKPRGNQHKAGSVLVTPLTDKAEDPAEGKPAPGYLVQRREDGKYLSFDGKPTSDISEAEPHDSRSMAGIWAERATRERPGTWEAVPHPGAGDPDGDDDPSLALRRAA